MVTSERTSELRSPNRDSVFKHRSDIQQCSSLFYLFLAPERFVPVLLPCDLVGICSS